MTRPNELYVEEQTARYFVRADMRTIQASEIDSTERTNSADVILQGRLTRALRKLNPVFPIDQSGRITGAA